MKRIALIIFVSSLILSCSNGKKTADSAETSEPVKVESEEWNEQSEDHYAIWQMDSTNEVNFITYDLAAMQVHGHVKRIVEDGGNVARFDENGNLTSFNDMYSDYMIGHNDDGCLTTYAVGAGSVTYSINPETDQLVCFSGGEGSTSWVNWYKYDDNGQLIEIEYNIEDMAEETTKSGIVLPTASQEKPQYAEVVEFEADYPDYISDLHTDDLLSCVTISIDQTVKDVNGIIVSAEGNLFIKIESYDD